MRVSLLSLLMVFSFWRVGAQQPAFEWAARLTGTHSYHGHSMAVDGSGNIYITGGHQGTTDFDPGPGVFNLPTIGGQDAFVCKLNSSGALVWAKTFANGPSQDIGRAIAVDADGNVYVTGHFAGTADFDPGAGIYNMSSTGVSNNDIFLLKLDSSGAFQWAHGWGGLPHSGGSDEGRSLAIDDNGDVYLTGVFHQTVDFDPGPSSANIYAGSGSGTFVCKLNGAGNLIWVKHLQSNASYSYPTSSALDGSGDILITGYYGSNAVDFDPGPAAFTLPVGGTYVWKLSSAGNFVWAKNIGLGAQVESYSIATDPAGNVYTTGGFATSPGDFDPGSGTATLTPNGWDVFVSKLTPAGNFAWARKMGGSSPSAIDRARAIAIDAAGAVYITGEFGGTADFDPGPGVFDLTAVGTYGNAFVSMLDAAGDFGWARALGHSIDYSRGSDIKVDGSGTVHVVGHWAGAVDFDPTAGIFLPATGPQGVSVIKWPQTHQAPAITTQPPAQTACAGTSATFSVFATNVGTYQWRKNGTDISGATSPTYTVTGLTPADSNSSFDVVLTPTGGAFSDLTADTATLHVLKHRWLGTQNTAWVAPSNWNMCGVPTSTSFVEIAPTAPYMPNISTTVNLWNLTSKGAITVAPNGVLNILGQ